MASIKFFSKKIFQSIGFVFLISICSFGYGQRNKGCKNIEKSLFKRDYEYNRIKTRIGPEDMVLDTITKNGPRLILGSTEYRKKKKYKADQVPGAILYYPLYDDGAEVDTFKIEGYPTQDFKPHGLAIAQLDNIPYLFVISHEQQQRVHKIIQFEIMGDRLMFRKVYSSETYNYLSNPNDLFVTPDGGIYYTNPSKLTLWTSIFKTRNGHVAHITTEGEERKLIAGLIYPNGILIAEDQMYITTTMKNQLLNYRLANAGSLSGEPVKVLAKIKGGDNISISGSTLYIAHHPNKLRFAFYAQKNSKSPSRVTTYNLSNDFCRQVFRSNGKLISGSSTAVMYKGHLYVTQVIQGFIAKVPENQLQDCKCKK